MGGKKVLFIVNPKSGKGLIKNHLLSIVDIFTQSGMEITLYTSQCEQDAVRIIRERVGEFETVICSGGDGTLDEVITGMMQCGQIRPVGYIPSGSTNDFANSLKLPTSMKEAASDITLGEPFYCDIGSFNEDYFVYIAAFGIFTDVSYQTKQEMKNLLGHLAYVLEGARRIFNIKSYMLKMCYCEMNQETKEAKKETPSGSLECPESMDAEKVIEGEYIYGMITNSNSVGGFRDITGEHVELDDGVFEVTLIHMPKNALELQEIITCMLKKEMDSELIDTFKTSYLEIEAEEEIPWTLDGEYGGLHKGVKIVNHMQAVPIIIKSLPDLIE